MKQIDINKAWATRPKPNKTKATAYNLNSIREFDKEAQRLASLTRTK